MLALVPELDTLVVPIGGGGLISGVAIAAKALRPGIRVIGVQSPTYTSMKLALEGHDAPVSGGMAIAEGIAVKAAGQLTRQIVRYLVDDILLVEESSIERAVALLLSVEKTSSKVRRRWPGGPARASEHFVGQTVGMILSGGNIDLRAVADVAMRELAVPVTCGGSMCRSPTVPARLPYRDRPRRCGRQHLQRFARPHVVGA